jgi:hypothetical protein
MHNLIDIFCVGVSDGASVSWLVFPTLAAGNLPLSATAVLTNGLLSRLSFHLLWL